MSKQVRKHPMMMWRLLGYITPLIAFVLLALWFKPQSEIGWVAVLMGTALAFMVSLATLMQARSEAHKKKDRRIQGAESLSIMEARPPAESRFYGPYGGMRSTEQSMGYWLELQEPVPTP